MTRIEVNKVILELSGEEKSILREAVNILRDITDEIDEDRSLDYYANSEEMILLDNIYDAIRNVEDYVSLN